MRFLSGIQGVELVARQNARITNSGAIANTETQVVTFTAEANTLKAGDVIRVTAYYTRAGTNATQATARIRIGSTTLAGAIASTLTFPGAATAVAGCLELLAVVRTIGTGGTANGSASNLHNATSPLISNTTAVTVNTTISNIIEFTVISGQATNSYTFSNAVIELLSSD